MPSGIINFARPVNAATASTSLETEYRVSFPSNNEALVEWYMTLDPANVPQVSTITITSGTVADAYVISVTASGSTNVYRYSQVTGDTAAIIAQRLATFINTNPAIQATSSSNVITLLSLIPGQSFAAINTNSTTPANVVIATTTPNSGTVIHRKIGEVKLDFSVSSAGFPVVSMSGNWFDAALTPAIIQPFGPLSATGKSSVDSIQIAQGIARA